MIGRTLSHFKITAKLGEGGMGAVYRADDTKLRREVAIKILPEEFTTSPERRARFEREARSLAALNHPSIAGIYEVGETATDGLHFLVMELADGEDLAARLSRGSIPVAEALPLGLQIAEALEAAHEKGIVHRDLKPSNVMVSPDGQIKVLDFGLAKIWSPDSTAMDTELAGSPTLTAQMTQADSVLGTAAYMSPEQARGQEADQRSDIWSFGAVLWEMLVGRSLFAKRTMAETLAAVLSAEVDWRALPDETPPAVQRLLRRSLKRNPKQRLHSVADARLEIQEAVSGSEEEAGTERVTAASTRAGRLLLAVAVLLALALVALGVVVWRQAGRKLQVVRALVSPPQGSAFFLESGRPGPVAVSPDGAWLAFCARGTDGFPRLWIRSLEDPEPRVLPGTEGARFPFWSPDSQSVAFTNGETLTLSRIDITGGPPGTLCNTEGTGLGTWSEDGVILYAPNGRLHRVDANGEGCEPLTVLDATTGVQGFVPHFLPDGQRFLYLAQPTSPSTDDYSVMIGSLDGAPSRELMRSGSKVEMAADHLWFVDQGTLLALPFDPARELITGEALPIAEGVGKLPSASLFSVSQSGVLAFHGPKSAERTLLTWRDRSGQSLGTLGPPARHIGVELSPNGEQAATFAYGEVGFIDVWLHDVATEVSTQFTFRSSAVTSPIWSPDGDRIAFSQYSPPTIEVQPAFGGASSEVLWKGEPGAKFSLLAEDWSPDGSLLLATANHPAGPADVEGPADIWVVPLDTETAPYPLLETPFNEFVPALSPDGRWLAYCSDESGQNEVYVTSFPDRGRKWQVSKEGGWIPEWSQRGEELFYLDSNGDLVAVSVDLEDGSFVPRGETKLFHIRLNRRPSEAFSASRDGRRFLTIETDENAAVSQVHLLLGWKQLLERSSDS